VKKQPAKASVKGKNVPAKTSAKKEQEEGDVIILFLACFVHVVDDEQRRAMKKFPSQNNSAKSRGKIYHSRTAQKQRGGKKASTCLSSRQKCTTDLDPLPQHPRMT
jgi:hypothetical protein